MTKMPKPAVIPGYLERAIAQVLAAGVKPGAVCHVVVEHQDGCPMLRGERRCTCNPTVTRCEGEA